MSQLSKRNALSLRREWRLFDQDRGTPEAYLKLCNRMIEVGEFCSLTMLQELDLNGTRHTRN